MQPWFYILFATFVGFPAEISLSTELSFHLFLLLALRRNTKLAVCTALFILEHGRRHQSLELESICKFHLQDPEFCIATWNKMPSICNSFCEKLIYLSMDSGKLPILYPSKNEKITTFVGLIADSQLYPYYSLFYCFQFEGRLSWLHILVSVFELVTPFSPTLHQRFGSWFL